MYMKNILTIIAIMLMLAACAPQAPIAPATQPEEVVEPQVAEQPPAGSIVADENLGESASENMGVSTPANENPGAKTVDVEMKEFKFLPVEITIKAGDTVRWTNNDRAPHDATAKDKSWKTALLRTGNSATVTFDTPGTYEYYCSIHPGMKAKVIVE